MSGYIDHRNSLKRIARHDDQDCSKESILNMMDRFVKTVSVMDDTILIPSRLMDQQVGDATDIVPMPGKGTATSTSPSHHHNHHHHHHHHHSHNKKKTSVRDTLDASSLHDVFLMLNKMKTVLLWGRNQDMIEEVEVKSSPATVTAVAATAIPVPTKTDDSATATSAAANNKQDVKGHIRRPSTASMASSNSSTGSMISDDSESEISNENDSGIESENNHNAEKSEELAKQFRMHLNGLYRTLEQMTEAANYLTARYQSDMGQV